MGAGRWLGLRLVANRVPGQALWVSEPVLFFAQPPFEWVSPIDTQAWVITAVPS